MGSLTRMATKCRSCPERDNCDNKRMEACAFMDNNFAISEIAMSSVTELMQPMLIPHDYRDLKVGENTTITIDVEELKRQIEKEIYKSAGIGLNYGA